VVKRKTSANAENRTPVFQQFQNEYHILPATYSGQNAWADAPIELISDEM
jgi:hypothetical protein